MLTKFVALLLAFTVSITFTFLTSRHLNTTETSPTESRSQQRGGQCSPLRSKTNAFEVDIDGRRYPQVVPAYLNKSLDFECLNQGPLKQILIWNPFWWSKTYDFGIGTRTPFENYKCPLTNCAVTNDRSQYNCSDLVLFHAFNLLNRDPLTPQLMPTHRPEGQRWVYTYFESPVTFENMCFKGLKGKFSLMNTYHSASDFNSVYFANALFDWKQNETFNDTYDYHATKVIDVLCVCDYRHFSSFKNK